MSDTLTLMRGQVPVTSFLGSLGGTLRETRVTAMIGYLIAHDPVRWGRYLKTSKPISSVQIEADYEKDRADIVVDTTDERIVIEAKVTWTDPKAQVAKYPASRTVMLTNYAPSSAFASKRLRYLSWESLAIFLNTLSTSKPHVRHLAKELIGYMREHQLIRSKDTVEIYAREINDRLTTNTFLKARIYGCWLEKGGGTISRAMYFAPHFGQWIAKEHPGIFSGISYVAKIEAVEVTDTWESFLAAARKWRGAWWLKKHRDLMKEFRQGWTWNSKTQRNIAFLGTPRLVFNPPINKNLLQKGHGWLSRRTFTFDELFNAWALSGTAQVK